MEEEIQHDGASVPDRPQTWSELYGEVCELRRQLSSLASMLPSSLVFRNIPGTGRTRIYFLGAPPSTAWESTLLAADVPAPGDADANRSVLQWQPVLEANFQALSSGGRLSREEQLLWERKRLATWGLTSFELHPESGRLVFPVASRLYQCVDLANTVSMLKAGTLCPAELHSPTNSLQELQNYMSYAKLNPQFCPHNPDLVAFVCLNDIWVTNTVTGSTVRLTHYHKGPPSTLVEDPLSAGTPSYVMQEEFSRYQGYWWQPCATEPGIYKLVFELVDETEVDICCFPSSGSAEEFRFPRAGTPNARSELKIAQFKLNNNRQINDVKILSLTENLQCIFTFVEYVVRVGWTPEGKHVWCQLLDRKQQRLDLALISVDSFILEQDPHHLPNTLANLPAANVCTLYSETSEVWVNVHDVLYFFPNNDDKQRRTFLWASEETGFRHLYLITVNLGSGSASNCVDEINNSTTEGVHRARVERRLTLTTGDWEVLPRSVWVDEDHSLVFFQALKDSPLEKHLYVVSTIRPGAIRLLTRPGNSYNIDMNQECSLVVAVYSNIRQLPACQVFRVSYNDWTVEGVNLSPVGYLLEPQFPDVDCHCPEILTHQLSSGETLYAMLFKPKGFDPDKKYPTVLNIYGGPEVQLVSNSFKGMRHLRMHMLASRGYCVLAIDSRGSLHRGIKFEGHLQGRMGTVELADQVEVLRGLSNRLGCIDLNRVAIHGWSYGGYLSLLGLALYPDVFKVSIAGAPVTSWSFYDTGYTERYMGLPDSNVLGYRSGSVLQYVHQFPDEEDRLLVIHGLMDENVHFLHTSMLVNALVKAGKPYHLQVYPNERHSLRSVDASKHYETKLLAFLSKHL